jgi:hypothetical protein
MQTQVGVLLFMLTTRGKAGISLRPHLAISRKMGTL